VGVKTGWAVVGLGVHAVERMLPALARAHTARLVGAYSRRPEVTREIAGRYGARGYETLDHVLRDPDVDIVYLATPNDVHAAQTLRCAEAGKHVLVEKPMALSVEDADSMVHACAQARTRLYVGFHLRFHPAHQRARALVTSGAIGSVVWAGARWASYRDPDVGWRLDPHRSGGTLLTARGVHLIDLVRFVCAADFQVITGCSDGFRAERPADDLTEGIGTLTSGAFAHILCSRLVPGAGNDLEIYGTRGTVICQSTIGVEPKGTLALSAGPTREAFSYEPCDVLAGEFDWVSAAVADGPREEWVGATGEDGARVAAVTCGLVAAVRSGRAVPIEYPV
jgi:1,5-anhydro-D-fructose reductase (1,5-anhydro-D-mannitol-forming)